MTAFNCSNSYGDTKMILVVTICFLMIFTGCSSKSNDPEPTPEVKISHDIHYISGDTSVRRSLDVYYETGSQSHKVVFFVPGGAWKQGDKNMYEEFGLTLCRYFHYVVVVINYRLSDSTQGNAVHPDHIEDVASAYKWMNQNISTYHGDPQQVFVFGQSAGAHLAALLVTDLQYLNHEGLTRDQIRGLIVMSGAYNLNHFVTFPGNPLGMSLTDVMMYKVMVTNAFGSTDSSVITPASPAFHVDNNLPPVLIIHTEYDMPGLSSENEKFFNQLNSLGTGPVSVHKIYQSDYSSETWTTATEMANAEPAVSDYPGHYAEVVAINEYDRSKVPTTWIVTFINNPGQIK